MFGPFLEFSMFPLKSKMPIFSLFIGKEILISCSGCDLEESRRIKKGLQPFGQMEFINSHIIRIYWE
jgi:hypothetical protein